MFDLEAVKNLTNATFDEEPPPIDSTFYIVCDIVFAILCAFGICLDSFIIHIMFSFPKMHTVPNIFIAHWAIADLCSLIVIPINYRLIEVIEGVKLPFMLGAFLYQLEEILRDAFVLFAMAVVIDWCLSNYFKRASEKFRKRYIFAITFIWSLTLFSLCVNFGLSLYNFYFHVPLLFLFFVYALFFIFIIILQFCNLVNRCRKIPFSSPTLTLTLTSVVVLCWWPVWASVLFESLFSQWFLLVECSILSVSFISFVTLYCANRDFQACFFQVLKCSANRYANEIPESQRSGKNGSAVQVYFHQNGREEH